MEMPRPPSQGGEDKLDLIKLKDGEAITGIVIGNFYTFHSKFNGKYFELSQKGVEGAKFRFRVNFAVKDGSQWNLKVLEQGAMLYDALFDLNKEFPLEDNVITIKRKGSGANDTEYSALPSAKVKITKEEAAYLASITPIDLRHEELKEEEKFNEI